MERLIELTIVAQSEDDFDDVCDRAEALSEVTVSGQSISKQGSQGAFARVVLAYRCDPETLTVSLELNADALQMLDLSFEPPLDDRETLLAIETSAAQYRKREG